MPGQVLSGGDKLKARLDAIARAVGNGGELQVGFFEDATYPHGGIPVAAVAAIQEFGAPNAPMGSIPPRPFFRNMIAAHSDEWGDKLASALKAFDYDLERALEFLGQDIEGELRQSIIDTNDPPLSEVTLMLRSLYSQDQQIGRREVLDAIRRVKRGERATISATGAKPLVRTGTMLRSVHSKVIVQ
jgi:hypothetical protein